LKTKIIIILIVVFLSASACDLFNIKGHNSGNNSKSDLLTRPVARAHKTYLYYKDLEGLIPANTSKSDSINLISRYVRSWINKQLVIAEASEKLNIDEADLERKLLDYQYAILIHEYQKFYIEQKLNEEVQDNEIEQYYTLNKDNFPLRQSIVKCRFVKVPVEAPKINQLHRLLQSSAPKDFRDLKSYCYQYATTFFLDSIWMNFDEIVKNTPLVNIDNKVHFIMNNRYYETSDNAFFYAFKINEYRISNEIAPLDWVKDDIKKIILNKRKVALAKELEDKIYDRADKNHDFEIFEIN
jgi:hypothetical protein